MEKWFRFLFVLLSLSIKVSYSQEYNIQTLDGTSQNACGGTFVDGGGSASGYTNGADQVITFKPTNAGDGVCLDFSTWDLGGSTSLSFYDGLNTSARLIFKANNEWENAKNNCLNPTTLATDPAPTSKGPGMVCSSGGPLTVVFKRSGTGAGFLANILCFSPPSNSVSCQVDIKADKTTICKGEQVNLILSGTTSNKAFDNNFNTSTIGTGWSSTVNPRFDNPCNSGVGYNNTPALWMGTVDAPRSLATNALNTTNGGSISFAFTMADDDDNAPCEGPDKDEEAIFFQYSNDGVNWNNIATFYEGWATQGADVFVNNWQKYFFAIPPAARTVSSKFRLFQSCITSSSTDHWGVDEFVISLKSNLTITLKDKTAGGTGLGTYTSSPDSIIVKPLVTTLYEVTLSDGTNSCTDTITITVNNGSVSNAGSDITHCNNNSFTMSANQPGSSSGAWSVFSGTVSPISSVNPTQVFALTGQDAKLIWQLTDGSCVTKDTVLITNNTGNVTPSFDSIKPICSGKPLAALPDTSKNGIIGSWLPLLNKTITKEYTFTPDTGQCGASAVKLTVTVYPSDTASVSIAASSTIVCPNDTITFTATPVHGGNNPSYQWKVNGLPVGTDSSVFKSASLNSGDYVKVIMSSSDTCVVASPATSFQITLSATAGSVLVAADKDTICLGDTVIFTATPDDPGAVNSYQWKINGNLVGSDSSTFTATNLVNGDSVTVVTNVNSSCGSGSIEGNKIRIVVNSIPTISASLVNISCNGFNDGSALIGANGGKPNYLYSKDGIVFQPQNSFYNLQAANYSFTVKDQNGCKGKIDTAVLAPPPITFIVNPVSAIICFGDSVKITATGYSSFNWFNITAGTKLDTNKTTVKVAPTTNTVYKVVSTLCNVSDSVDITVLSPVLIDPIADKTICLGEVASFKANASGGKGVFNYTWTPAPDFISAKGDSASIKPSSLAPITFLLKAQNDCPGYLSSFKVYIDPLPLIQIQTLSEICAGEKIDLVNQLHSSNYIAYNWDFSDGGLSSDTASTSHVYMAASNYNVFLTVTDSNNCKNSDTSDVILVNSNPQGIIFNAPSEDLNTNSVVLFTADKSIGDIKKYQWSFADLGVSNNVDSSLIFRDAGDYIIRLIVFNDKCADTVLKTIKIVNDYALFVPSSFTPNEDGNNDFFVPKGFGVINFSLQIWNQWGEMVFESDDFIKGWDGIYQNKLALAPEGIYVYKIKFNAIGKENEKALEKNGHVTLTR